MTHNGVRSWTSEPSPAMSNSYVFQGDAALEVRHRAMSWHDAGHGMTFDNRALRLPCPNLRNICRKGRVEPGVMGIHPQK